MSELKYIYKRITDFIKSHSRDIQARINTSDWLEIAKDYYTKDRMSADGVIDKVRQQLGTKIAGID